MQFQPLTLDDIEKIRPFFLKQQAKTCDFSVGGMFMWRNFFKMEYAVCDGIFYSRLHNEQGQVFYNLPLADDIDAALVRLLNSEVCAERPVRFCTVPEEYLPLFESVCTVTRTEEQRDYFDYLYRAEDLIELHGKKFSGQRNQISQFMRANEQFAFTPISPETAVQAIEFFTQGYINGGPVSASEQEENEMVLEVLRHLDRYKMVGGFLTAGSRMVGFSLGEIIRDTLFTHIEKADRTCKGAYQILTNQFARAFAVDGIRYINREEDMGDPGLRRAKEAYHPVALLKKYIVEVT